MSLVVISLSGSWGSPDDIINPKNHLSCFCSRHQNVMFHLVRFCNSQLLHVTNGSFHHI